MEGYKTIHLDSSVCTKVTLRILIHDWVQMCNDAVNNK